MVKDIIISQKEAEYMTKNVRRLYNNIPTENRKLSKKGQAYLNDNSTYTGGKTNV